MKWSNELLNLLVKYYLFSSMTTGKFGKVYKNCWVKITKFNESKYFLKEFIKWLSKLTEKIIM